MHARVRQCIQDNLICDPSMPQYKGNFKSASCSTGAFPLVPLVSCTLLAMLRTSDGRLSLCSHHTWSQYRYDTTCMHACMLHQNKKTHVDSCPHYIIAQRRPCWILSFATPALAAPAAALTSTPCLARFSGLARSSVSPVVLQEPSACFTREPSRFAARYSTCVSTYRDSRELFRL